MRSSGRFSLTPRHDHPKFLMFNSFSLMLSDLSRRNFLTRAGGAVSAVWLSAHWPAIVAAAEHAHQAAKSASPAKFQFFSPELAVEIDAITARIIPFYETVRVHTIVGFLIDPESGRGGNRDGIGWKLIGRDREHMFQPPFGYYDKDYAGWQPNPPDAEKTKA